MTHKCLNQLAPAYLSGCFSKLSGSHTRILRNSATDVHIPRMRTSNGQKCFAYRGAKVWNDLDSETKLASNIQCFKSRLKNYQLPQVPRFHKSSIQGSTRVPYRATVVEMRLYYTFIHAVIHGPLMLGNSAFFFSLYFAP